MANGNYRLALLCNIKSTRFLNCVEKNSLDKFRLRLGDTIKLLIFALTKIGLVAQLNSALDYGSRGYWFESSQGH